MLIIFSKSTIKDDDQKLFQYDSAVREGAFSSSDVQFAVIGDYGVAGQPQADVATLVKNWNPGFIITLGDNNYPLGEAATIDANIGQYYHDYIYPYTGSYGAGASVNRFYPILGSRVWCRFGCPMAAYLGILQRFTIKLPWSKEAKRMSKFRITTNGGQCISCGNCSTYCEMGIDVKAYAQRQEDIVRASCVGCGICSAVCPRGVLRLENL